MTADYLADTWGVLDQLGSSELGVLETLRKAGRADEKEISTATGLYLDEARAAAEKLEGFGLVTHLRDQRGDAFVLNAEGLLELLKAVEDASEQEDEMMQQAAQGPPASP